MTKIKIPEIGLCFQNQYLLTSLIHIISRYSDMEYDVVEDLHFSNYDFLLTDTPSTCIVKNTGTVWLFGAHNNFSGALRNKVRFINVDAPFCNFIIFICNLKKPNVHDNCLRCNFSFTYREMLIIDYMKCLKRGGVFDPRTIGLNQKTYSYSLRKLMEKIEFDNKIQLYKWVVNL